MNFTKAKSEVLAAIDLGKIDPALVYDLDDPAVRQAWFARYSRWHGMYDNLASEGVVAIRGSIPSEAVVGVAHIPPGLSEAQKLELMVRLLTR